jgi:pimeloyl-ACP methyl ester carboxylesterase
MSSWTTRALNVRQVGDGPKAVVLAHGFGANQGVWFPYLEPLSRGYRVITYDLPCAATADREFFDMTRHRKIDGYIDDLMAILDDLEIANCAFVGHSVSGMVGLLASLRRRDRFSKIVAIGASACYLNRDAYQGGFSQEDLKQVFLAIGSNYRNWAQAYAPYVVDRPMHDSATTRFLDGLLAMRGDVALATAQMILLADYRALMNQVETPSAILQTRSDPAVPMAAATFLHDHIRGSTLEMIDASGHMPHMTSVDLVLPALQRHLDLDSSGGMPAATVG